MFFSKVLLLASLALSANALYTPLAHRSPHQHRGLAARVAAVAPQDPSPPVVRVTPRKRAVKRCKGSSTPTIATPTEAASSSSAPAATQAPVNAGNGPPVFSSSESVSPSPDPTNSPTEQSPASSSTKHSSSSSPTPPVNAAPSPSIEPSSSPAPSPSSRSASRSSSSSNRPQATPTPATTKASSTKKTTATPTPTQANSGGSGSGTVYSGDGTFYATGLGACGIVNNDNDMIAAIAHGFFDSFGGGYTNPNNAPICNKRVRATYQGNSVEVTLTDRCGGCVGEALDFSPAAFNKLADPSVGRIHNVEWTFI